MNKRVSKNLSLVVAPRLNKKLFKSTDKKNSMVILKPNVLTTIDLPAIGILNT